MCYTIIYRHTVSSNNQSVKKKQVLENSSRYLTNYCLSTYMNVFSKKNISELKIRGQNTMVVYYT